MPPAYQHCWHFHYINVSVYVSVFRKGVSEDRVSLEDREHAKRIVYSVVYGAGENYVTHNACTPLLQSIGSTEQFSIHNLFYIAPLVFISAVCNLCFFANIDHTPSLQWLLQASLVKSCVLPSSLMGTPLSHKYHDTNYY